MSRKPTYLSTSARQRTGVWMKECAAGGACTPSSTSLEMCWEGAAASGSMGCASTSTSPVLPQHRQDGQNQLGDVSSSRRDQRSLVWTESSSQTFTGVLFRALCLASSQCGTGYAQARTVRSGMTGSLNTSWADSS